MGTHNLGGYGTEYTFILEEIHKTLPNNCNNCTSVVGKMMRRIWQVGLTRRPFNRVTMSLEENVGTCVASLVILNNGNLDLIASEK